MAVLAVGDDFLVEAEVVFPPQPIAFTCRSLGERYRVTDEAASGSTARRRTCLARRNGARAPASPVDHPPFRHVLVTNEWQCVR